MSWAAMPMTSHSKLREMKIERSILSNLKWKPTWYTLTASPGAPSSSSPERVSQLHNCQLKRTQYMNYHWLIFQPNTKWKVHATDLCPLRCFHFLFHLVNGQTQLSIGILLNSQRQQQRLNANVKSNLLAFRSKWTTAQSISYAIHCSWQRPQTYPLSFRITPPSSRGPTRHGSRRQFAAGVPPSPRHFPWLSGGEGWIMEQLGLTNETG